MKQDTGNIFLTTNFSCGVFGRRNIVAKVESGPKNTLFPVLPAKSNQNGQMTI